MQISSSERYMCSLIQGSNEKSSLPAEQTELRDARRTSNSQLDDGADDSQRTTCLGVGRTNDYGRWNRPIPHNISTKTLP